VTVYERTPPPTPIDRMYLFLCGCISEDEMWAREASRDSHGLIPTGAHWRWVDGDDDTVIPIDPNAGEHAEFDGQYAHLRSVEELHYDFGRRQGTSSQVALGYVEELPTVPAGHIMRHDPARVLADCTSRRAVIERILSEEHYACEDGWLACATQENYCQDDDREGTCTCDRDDRVLAFLTDMAIPYADRPDYPGSDPSPKETP
jgi:hypothetical protein